MNDQPSNEAVLAYILQCILAEHENALVVSRLDLEDVKGSSVVWSVGPEKAFLMRVRGEKVPEALEALKHLWEEPNVPEQHEG